MKPGLNNRRGDSDRTEIEEVTRQKQRQLIYVFLTVLFGLSVLLFIVGLLYLTVFFYRWSFIEFSTTICAALFISFGGTLIIMIILNGIMVRADRFQFVLLTPLVSFAFFGTLLGIGIWGLAVSHDPRLSDEVRRRILETMRFYVESVPSNEATRKIDWMQSGWRCCGAESSFDWRNYYLYGGGSGLPQNNYNTYNRHPNSNFFQPQQQQLNIDNQVYFGNQFVANVNYPQMSRTPDSCCVAPYYNCGKQGNRWPNSGNMYGQNNDIYTQGCMSMFYPRWLRDLRFVAGFCTGVAVIGLILSVLFLGLYFFIKKKTVYG